MKKIILTTVVLLVSGLLLSAQEEKEVKTGWSFGVLPCATYSVDNGLQYGAFGDVYYYGDGSTYPDPVHKISWEASHFTKGKTRLYLGYDSKYLIPNMRVNASVTYVDDPMYSFWGYNGTAALQNYDIWSNKGVLNEKKENKRIAKGEEPTGPIFRNPDGSVHSVNYYGMSRKMFRALVNVQGRITDNLNWAAGINFWNWRMGDMRDSGNEVKGADGKKTGEVRYYDTDLTLYKRYQAIGAIPDDEADGGNALEFNTGLVFDTRDMEAAPNRGVWAEAYLNGNVLDHQYLKACVYFRNYIDIPIHIKAGDPVFAYRLAWQQTIAGETPFYMIQNVPLLVQRNMISEGFGSSNTIRGIRENRILTEGFAWTNMELRVKLVSFKLLNQFFYIAVNPFFDAGIITKPYRNEAFALTTTVPATYQPMNKIYDETKLGDIVYSGGAGLKIAMNQNFIVSVEVAHCFYQPLNADLWIGIGINYQF